MYGREVGRNARAWMSLCGWHNAPLQAENCSYWLCINFFLMSVWICGFPGSVGWKSCTGFSSFPIHPRQTSQTLCSGSHRGNQWFSSPINQLYEILTTSVPLCLYCCCLAPYVNWAAKDTFLFLPNISSVPTQVAAVFMQEVDTPADYRRTLAASTEIILSLECWNFQKNKIQRETCGKEIRRIF
jgi:hypothetical protein